MSNKTMDWLVRALWFLPVSAVVVFVAGVFMPFTETAKDWAIGYLVGLFMLSPFLLALGLIIRRKRHPEYVPLIDWSAHAGDDPFTEDLLWRKPNDAHAVNVVYGGYTSEPYSGAPHTMSAYGMRGSDGIPNSGN